MIDRRTFLKTVGSLSASALFAPGVLAADEVPGGRKRPNFVVIVADDQCYRTLGALNNAEVHTPALNRLLARGTTFTHCFHQGSWTGAVCVASRAMMHTGRYLWYCGGENCGHFPLMGEALRRAGYKTCVIGKWHNGDQTALRSFMMGRTIGPGFFPSTPIDGLAYNRPRPGDPWTPWDPKYGGHWTPGELWDIEGPAARDTAKAGPRYNARRHSCELYADSAVSLLHELGRQDKPFLLYVAWNSPHDPRQAPRDIVEMYPAEKMGVPPNFLPRHGFDQGDSDCRDELLAPFPRTPEIVQVHRREYYALITYMDRQLGRILDALEKTREARDTYIIVTADHGLAVGEHGLLGKQNLYDCSVRMPFIIAGPDIPAGKQIDSLMYQHCLFPTICDLGGISVPPTVQFSSVAPLLRGRPAELFDSIYCAYRGFQRMVRTNHHKLILYPQVKIAQLFDIAQDPWETESLDVSSHAELAASLFWKLNKWQRDTGDTLALEAAGFGIGA